MIRSNLLIILSTIFLIICVAFATPTYALDNQTIKMISPLNHNLTLLADLNYETKETTSLSDPITDPNFNVMRNNELGRSLAIPLVLGVLIIAIITPLVTWWYFSR